MNTNTQKTLGFFLITGLMAMLPGAAQAQCGSIYTTNTTLTASVVCSGNGPVLAASNITLDCAGHTISGIGSGIGILLDNVNQSAVINCSVDNFGVGFRIDGGSHNRLSNNTATNNQSTVGGFNITNGSIGNWLEGNFSGFNPVGRGFSVNDSHKNTLIYNEAFNNGFRGFDIINADFNTLYGNSAVNNSSAGMVVQNYAGGTSTGNRLYKNYIEGSGSEGLAMFASGNTVEFLTSDNNGTWGIRDTSGGANTYNSNNCTGNPSGTSSPSPPPVLCF